jgi:hypothetical protein
MKSIITTIQQYLYTATAIVAISMFVYAVLPAVSQSTNGNTAESNLFAGIASAQWFDSGSLDSGYSDAGYSSDGCCDSSWFDFGGSNTSNYADTSTWYDTGALNSGYSDAGYTSDPCCNTDWYNYSDQSASTWYDSGYLDNGYSDAGYYSDPCCNSDWYNYSDSSASTWYDSGYLDNGYSDAGYYSDPCCTSDWYDSTNNYAYDDYAYDDYAYDTNYDDYAYDYSYEQPSYSYDYNYTQPSYSYDYAYDYTYVQPPYIPPVYVTPPPPPVVHRPTCTLNASDTTITRGDDITLTWDTTHATRVSISSIGSVSLDGSRTLSPTRTTTYTLTATGSGGSVTCTEEVTVEVERTNVRCDAFTVSDSNVRDGDTVTLDWETTGANDVRINNGVGSVSNDGTERVRITGDTTFTLTARNGSDSDTCRVTVHVETVRRTSTVAPRCELTISDTRIQSGDPITLTWITEHTDDIILRDSHGNTFADSQDNNRINVDRDAVTVRPTQSTDYTLTVYGRNNEQRECHVSVTVDSVSVASVRTQDGIPLTQVPYTGFDAGPVLTFIFYGAIGLWGIVIGYLLVLKKKAAVAVAHSASKLVVAAPVMHANAHLNTAHTTVAVADTEIADIIPFNLPTDEQEETALTFTEDILHTLENHAHAHYTLLSSDALRFIAGHGETSAEKIAILDRVITGAKARFPKEGDWIVLNKERVLSLLK